MMNPLVMAQTDRHRRERETFRKFNSNRVEIHVLNFTNHYFPHRTRDVYVDEEMGTENGSICC